MKKVGVLSLQGDFAAHGAALARAGAEPVYVREREQFRAIDGLGDSRRRKHHHAQAAAPATG